MIIGIFAYSAWVDRPARIREFTEVEVPKDLPELRMNAEKNTESVYIVARILNGCGVSGVAYKLREYLLTQGLDINETTNADHFNYEKTIVYLHKNDFKIAKIISEKLQMPNNPILDDRKPDYPCDVTILIGKDYKKLPPFNKE
ncbi:MAG: LytR C-terminal domain-containing protein [Fidelibacterota bacterium]